MITQPRYPALTLALLATAQFIIAVDYNIVYVALPSIGAKLGFSPHHLQWVVSAYAIAFGGFLLLGGRLGDVFGRRRAFIAALALYGGASLAGGFASTPLVLVVSRAVQGLGGALLFPATLALVSTFFEEGAPRHKALAVVGAAGASGGASGALLGGLLTSGFGWSWTFFVNVPVAAAAALAALMLLPRDDLNAKPGEGSIDVPGALTATGAITVLVLACVEGPELGWSDVRVLALLAGAAVLLGAFLMVEARTARPLMPLRLLRHPTLTAGMLIAAFFASSFGAQYYLLTTYLQDVRHYAPSMAGVAFLPFSLSIVAGTRIAAPLMAKIGLRAALLGGLSTGIAGLLMVAAGLTEDGSYATHLLPGFLLDGVGQGITWTLMWVVATSGIDAKDRGIASGMASTAQQVGNALGLALLAGLAASTVATGASQASDEALALTGLRHAFIAAAGLALLAVVVVLLRVKASTRAVPLASIRPIPVSDK